MMRSVVLHGHLKDFYPDPIQLAADNAAELINGLTRQIKAFLPKPGEPRHLLRVLGFDRVEDFERPLKDTETEIHIVPAFRGGKSGFFQIILGVVLIAASFFIGPEGLALGIGDFTISASSIFLSGALMLLQGLLSLISPAPSTETNGNNAKNPDASKYLGAPGNTVAIGTPITLGWGRVMLFGQYLSFNIQATDVANPASTTGTPTRELGPHNHPDD